MATSPQDHASAGEAAIEIVPFAGRIGAEIRGVDLSAGLDEAAVRAIRAALLRHKVIFFRDQHRLDDAGHEAFAEALGEPIRHPTLPVAEGSRYLLELNAPEGFAASNWHTDVTFLPDYPRASILRAVRLPDSGGDTMWANTVAAYEHLPEPLRLLADGLRAIHTNKHDYAETVFRKSSGEDVGYLKYQKDFQSVVYECDQPVVRVHPESGERALLLGGFVKKFVGLSNADSRRLYDILQDHVIQPENSARWRWRPGDVAVWDNYATQHRAVADFGTQQRQLRRATIRGEVAVGVDGGKARAIGNDRD
jgi:taurine dioxygenase